MKCNLSELVLTIHGSEAPRKDYWKAPSSTLSAPLTPAFVLSTKSYPNPYPNPAIAHTSFHTLMGCILSWPTEIVRMFGSCVYVYIHIVPKSLNITPLWSLIGTENEVINIFYIHGTVEHDERYYYKNSQVALIQLSSQETVSFIIPLLPSDWTMPISVSYHCFSSYWAWFSMHSLHLCCLCVEAKFTK